MPKRFPILRVLGVLYKVVGVIAAVFTVVGALGFCALGFAGGAIIRELERQIGMPLPQAGGSVAGVVAGLMVLLYGGFTALVLYGAGEGVQLFIAIEENIRSIAASRR